MTNLTILKTLADSISANSWSRCYRIV